jgi:hypothetical protein
VKREDSATPRIRVVGRKGQDGRKGGADGIEVGGHVGSATPRGYLRFMGVRELASIRPSRPCWSVCGVGVAEVVLFKQVLGLCLKLRLVVSGECPG